MSLARYFWFVLVDGDYENDWLTHLPHVVRPIVHLIGLLLSLVS